MARKISYQQAINEALAQEVEKSSASTTRAANILSVSIVLISVLIVIAIGFFLGRNWRELHALYIGRSEVKPLARLGRQRHKAINQLRLTS